MKALSWLFKHKAPFKVGDKVCLDRFKALRFPEFIKWYGFSTHIVNKIKRGPLKAGGWLIYLDRDKDCGLYSNYFNYKGGKNIPWYDKKGKGSYLDPKLNRVWRYNSEFINRLNPQK